jgi:replication factor A1
MDEIIEIYKKQELSGTITQEDFLERVGEKVNQMGGLCDTKTAAMLVAHDLGAGDTRGEGAGNEVQKVADITPGTGNVRLIAKVMSVFPAKEFNRNDGTIGRVANLLVADETGSIRLTLWDDKADLVKTGDITVGQTFQISGYVKEGYSGVEVNIGNNGVLCETDEKIEASVASTKITDIKNGMGDINLRARVLDIADIKTFNRKDGSTGRVSNITVGDDTGKIRVTLWDEKTDLLPELNINDSIEIINAYARENNFSQQVEVQVGNRTILKKTDKEVDYSENFTPISDIIPGESYSVKGSVSGIGDRRDFTRDDGTENSVSNIYVSDDTGRIRIALWGEHAGLIDEVDIDTEIEIIDAFSKSGFNDEIELSAGNRTRIIVL